MSTTRGDRLREERERLGIGQVPFAEACGVKKRAQFNYEQSERDPDADYLTRCLALGVDVMYVLTGDRREGSNRSTSTDLPTDERKLLKRYRALGKAQRKVALDILQSLALGASPGGHTNIVKPKNPTGPVIGSIHGGTQHMKPDEP